MALTRYGARLVRRVSVVGTPGSGKSTLARELAGILSVPHLELDSVAHQPGWILMPTDEFREWVGTALAGEGWVADGNYPAVRDMIWERADTIIWLDLPKRLVMRRLIWRTVRRLIAHQELWNGNQERWRNFFSLDPERSIIVWGWLKHGDYCTRYLAASQDPANAHLTFIRLTSPRSVRRFRCEIHTGTLRTRGLGLLAAQDAGDAGGDGRDEDPADSDEEVREPLLQPLRVARVPQAEANERGE